MVANQDVEQGRMYALKQFTLGTSLRFSHQEPRVVGLICGEQSSRAQKNSYHKAVHAVAVTLEAEISVEAPFPR